MLALDRIRREITYFREHRETAHLEDEPTISVEQGPRPAPEPITTAQLKDDERWYARQRRRHKKYALYSLVGAPVGEELLFRGVPLFIALAYTGHALALLLVGNLVWAYLHVVLGDADHTLPHFVGGFLEVFLWLHGLGLLAIALHAWHNLFVYSVRYGKRLFRRVHPRIFSRGEEHLVVIEPAPPSMRGLYRGHTADGRRVDVADGVPETACWVRIVHGGFIASGYPCAWPDASEN